MSKGKILSIVFIWMLIVSTLAMGYKWIIAPEKKKKIEVAIKEQEKTIVDQTSASSRYDNNVNFAIDGFGAFAVFRSDQFQNELAKKRIKVTLNDDGANYEQRIQDFKSGKVQMGVFTLDALIKLTNGNEPPPATVIALIDETRGVDGVVGYTASFPNIDSLNDPTVKFVLAPGPSETLARVLMSHFHMNNLGSSPFIIVPEAKDVFEMYRKSKPDAHQVYVTWEPWISKMTDNPNAHVIVDSSNFRGYIVDALVVNRDFLFKNRDLVQSIVETYFRVLYQNKDNMNVFLSEDAKKTDQPLNAKEIQKFINGIWIKNTSDNYAQMGIVDKANVQHVEDIIGNITKVLVSTGALKSDPTNGKPNILYYDGILKNMKDKNFYPGAEQARNETITLPELTNEQWDQLTPIGQLNVPDISFARGKTTLSDYSVVSLDELVEKLKTWQTYYLVVKGNTLNQGDVNANLEFAKTRANVVADYLIQHGIDKSRIHVSKGTVGNASVTFSFYQSSY